MNRHRERMKDREKLDYFWTFELKQSENRITLCCALNFLNAERSRTSQRTNQRAPLYAELPLFTIFISISSLSLSLYISRWVFFLLLLLLFTHSLTCTVQSRAFLNIMEYKYMWNWNGLAEFIIISAHLYTDSHADLLIWFVWKSCGTMEFCLMPSVWVVSFSKRKVRNFTFSSSNLMRCDFKMVRAHFFLEVTLNDELNVVPFVKMVSCQNS